MKLHTGLPLVLNLMTLNGIMEFILRYFTEIGTLGVSYVTVVEVRTIRYATHT